MIAIRTMLLGLAVMSITAGTAAQVLLPVAVKDSSGTVVHGLQVSDFALSCKNTTIQSVEEVAPVTVEDFSDPIPVFVVYDAESLSQANQTKMNSLLLSFLRSEETQHHAVTLLKNTQRGLELVNNFSSPPDVVLAALDRVSPDNSSVPRTSAAGAGPEVSKQVNEEVQRLKQLTDVVPWAVMGSPGSISVDQRMSSLQTVAKSLQGSQHRKLLLWVTGYLPVYIDNGVVKGASPTAACQGEADCGEARYASSVVRVTTAAWTGVVKALNESRISVSTAFLSGNLGDITECCVRLYQMGQGSGLENLARSTGGKQVSARSPLNFAALVGQLRETAVPYYLLTLKAASSDNRWVSCSIKVQKANVKVEAPTGFFSAP